MLPYLDTSLVIISLELYIDSMTASSALLSKPLWFLTTPAPAPFDNFF